MLNLPDKGYKVFQVSLYNEQVRGLAERRKHHCHYSLTWANEQVRDVVARDEQEALDLINQRFPPEDGFVIQRVMQSAY